ncbi:hypothetical protein DM860_015305 [Cuscuta australis]|uniref:Reverse transcriptase zinc-binding domain-containing protein n=1 Tax=Cuscuta australis TaxID=267555 RepID=A0A328DKR7_9ASTE|nr:hypothetical protein DM860_015305 [Cuscuta australis]
MKSAGRRGVGAGSERKLAFLANLLVLFIHHLRILFHSLETQPLSGLSKLGSNIGKPIKRDKATAKQSKFSYARIQIEEESVKVDEELKDDQKDVHVEEVNQTETNTGEEEFKTVSGKKAARRIILEDEGDLLSMSDQWIHCKCRRLGDMKEFYVTFVYGHNEATKRSNLWNDLMRIAASCNKAWCVIGDFNSILRMGDRTGGNPVSLDETKEFRQCIQNCGLEEIPNKGAKYTSSNRQGPGRRIFSKIDWAFANIDWFNNFEAKVIIKEEGLSDHTPLLVKDCSTRRGNFPFKFCDMWCLDPSFSKIVQSVWNQKMEGRYMFQLSQKLRMMKPLLRSLNRSKFSHIYQQCNLLREELFQIQEALKVNTNCEQLITKELELIRVLTWKLKAARLMKIQQVKQDWVQEGDKDSKLFHAWIKKRKLKNHISSIKYLEGNLVEGKNNIATVMVEYFQKLLGKTEWTAHIQKDIVYVGGVTGKVLDTVLKKTKMSRGMNTSNGYTVLDGYESLKGAKERVAWAGMVWSRWSLPKHQFIAWLIWKGMIQTKDRLKKFLLIDITCVMCDKEEESADHLFCSCAYANTVHGRVSGWLKVDIHADSIEDLCRKVELGRSRTQKGILAASIKACCYYIWKARNANIHSGYW